MAFACTSTNPDVKKDWTVDYGRGANAAAAEQNAKTNAARTSQTDAQKKAENEYACDQPCRIKGTARVTQNVIVKAGWRDPRGLWHATAKATWWLQVICQLGPVTARRKAAAKRRTGRKVTVARRKAKTVRKRSHRVAKRSRG
jgi:hypothetical protein